MATSRTGTAQYKAWRRRTLHKGQRDGITHCPCSSRCRHHTSRRCGVELDYTRGLRPNSAEPDHITPWVHGGRNTTDNGAILCRRCNQSVGDKTKTTGNRRPRPTAVKTVELNHSGW